MVFPNCSKFKLGLGANLMNKTSHKRMTRNVLLPRYRVLHLSKNFCLNILNIPYTMLVLIIRDSF